MYHGAEHKCINCVEHGLPLTVENVRNSSKEHKRCGTSFIRIVMVSILFFMVVRVDNVWMRFASRIVLVPVIAGRSYEILQLAGRSNSRFMDLVSRPWVCGCRAFTTKEPDDSMIEVAIAATEAVFDWKAYLRENFPDTDLSAFEDSEDSQEKEEVLRRDA